jgi:hypothetical protein
LKIIFGNIEIVPLTLLLFNAFWEANASRTFEINNISLFVPWIRVLCESSLTIKDYVRAMFLDESIQWRTAWTAIKPKEHWVSGLVLLTQCSDIVQALWSAWDIGISGVETPRYVSPLPELGNYVLG